MKRIAGVLWIVVLAAACATAPAKKASEPVEYVPVVTNTTQPAGGALGVRLTAVEKQQAALDAKLAQLSSKIDAQTAEMQALRKDLAASTAASHQSHEAAKEAQLAAARAEAAAQKSTKAFELSQVKGPKK
jgi:hypothetical protein